MAYLAVLLTFPDVVIPWRALRKAGERVAAGTAPATALPAILREPIEPDEWENSAALRAMAQENVEALQNMLTDLRRQMNGASGSRRATLQKEINWAERDLAKARNSTHRRTSSHDADRGAVYHALDKAFRCLAMRCPDLVRHLGTFRERRLLVVRDGGVMYQPIRPEGEAVEERWHTSPRVAQRQT